MKKLFLLLLVNLLMFSGCIDKREGSGDSYLKTDPEAINVPGDFSEQGDSIFTVNVSSNRSWRAHLNYESSPVAPDAPVDYAYLKNCEEVNFDFSPKTTGLQICFFQNPSKNVRKGVLELYSDGGLKKSIPITQSGIKYILKAQASKTAIGENGETVEIDVVCNTSWTARVESAFEIAAGPLSGQGNGTVRLEFPETDEPAERTASVIFSAEDCEDVRITFVQEKSSLMPFGKIRTSFVPSGSGEGIVPVLVIDETLVNPAAVAAGIKYHYTIGTKDFESLPDPSETDGTIPQTGLSFLPVGYQTVATATQTYSIFYIKILGVADGFKRSYTKAVLRNWSFGQKYIYNKSANGLTLSGAAGGKSTYYIRFASTGSTMSVSAVSTISGDARALMKYHSDANTSTVTFMTGEQVVHSVESKDIPRTAPSIAVTPNFPLEENTVISLNNLGPKFSFLWEFLIMEECTYKP